MSDTDQNKFRMVEEFKRIYELNRLWGNTQGSEEDIERQASFIPEEIDELYEAFLDAYIQECLDAYLDIMVFSVGILYMAEIEPEHIISDENNSNIHNWNTTPHLASWGPHDIEVTRHRDNIFRISRIVDCLSDDYVKGAAALVQRCIIWCLNRGISPADALAEVNKSNESKFCRTQKEVGESIQKFSEEGVKVSVEYDEDSKLYTLKSAENAIGRSGKAYPEGKVLKPVTFVEPDLSKFILTVS